MPVAARTHRDTQLRGEGVARGRCGRNSECVRVPKKQNSRRGTPSGFCFSRKLLFGVCKASGPVGSDPGSALTHMGKQARGPEMQYHPPEYKRGASEVAAGVPQGHRGLREPPLPRWRFSTKNSIVLAKGVKRDRITWLSLPAVPEEPKNLFSELTGSRKNLPLYQNGGEGLVAMGLRKAATPPGSLGNVSKGHARGNLNSAPFASVSPEVVTCHTSAQADVPDAQASRQNRQIASLAFWQRRQETLFP